MVLRRFPVKFSLLASSALLTGLCFAWHNVWFPAFFTLVPALLVMLSESGVTDKKPFRFYGYGYFFGVVFFAAVFQWFRYQYPLEYLGFSKGEAVAYVALSWFGSGFILSLLLSFFFLFTGLFLRSGLAKKHRWLFIPFSSACWVLTEYAFTLGKLATPWARLAVTQQSNTLFIQSASLFGSYFISALIVAVNASLSLGVYALITEKNVKKCGIFALAAALVFLSDTALGAILYTVDLDHEKNADRMSVSALQGNMISGRAELSLPETLELFLDMSEEQINDTGAELIVMPEGCFNMDLAQSPATESIIKSFAKEHSVSLIFGAYEYADDGFYNVTWCVDPDGTLTGPYRKQHPVPFGEFTPARDLILKLMPFLEDVTNIGDDLSAGKESTVFETQRGTVGAFICFDSAFENIGFRETAKGALLLTESTNDSWWMDSAQLYEHNGHAVLRAVEARRWYVRSSSAGYSTVIDARGVTVDGVPALTAGFASSDAALRTDISLYHRTPFLFPSLCFIVFAGGLIYAFVFEKRSKQ